VFVSETQYISFQYKKYLFLCNNPESSKPKMHTSNEPPLAKLFFCTDYRVSKKFVNDEGRFQS
jgi:hypothetical protein